MEQQVSAMVGQTIDKVLLHVKLSPSQERVLDSIFRMCADLYNSQVESWAACQEWRHFTAGGTGSLLSEDDLRIVREGRDHVSKWMRIDDRISRGVLKRKHRAVGKYEAGGQAPGVIDPALWDTVEIVDPDWDMLTPPSVEGKWWHLRVKGIPTLRFTDRARHLLRARQRSNSISSCHIARGKYTPFELQVATRRGNGACQPDPPAKGTVIGRPPIDTRAA